MQCANHFLELHGSQTPNSFPAIKISAISTPPGMARQQLNVFRTKSINPKRNTSMNTLEIKGDWNVTKGKIKQKWGQLTDNDLTYTKGQADELVGRIQKRTGETREAVEQALKDAEKDCNC